MHLLHAQIGKIAFLPDVMAVYRRNQGGIWGGAGQKPEWFIRCGVSMCRFYLAIQKQFGKDCKDELDKLSLLTYLHLQKDGNEDRIKELLSVYSPPADYLKNTFAKYVFYAIFSRFCFGKLRKKMRIRRKLLKEIIKFKKD